MQQQGATLNAEETQAYTDLLDLVVDKVQELTTKYPDAVYKPTNHQPCQYTQGDVHHNNEQSGEVSSCGCIVGQALLQVNPGFRPLLLQADEQIRPPSATRMLQRITGVPRHEPEAKKGLWLNEVQVLQDRGSTWGEAAAGATQRVSLPSTTKD